MKRIQSLFFSLILFIVGTSYSYSQDFIPITHISTDDAKLVEEKYEIVYVPEKSTIGIIDLNYEDVKVWKYGPVELSNTSYEQGLYIEEYSPTIEKLVNTSASERIYLI